MKNKFSITVVAVLLFFSLFSQAQSVMVDDKPVNFTPTKIENSNYVDFTVSLNGVKSIKIK